MDLRCHGALQRIRGPRSTSSDSPISSRRRLLNADALRFRRRQIRTAPRVGEKILSLEQAFYWLLSGGEIWIVLWKPRAVEYRDRSNRRRTRDEWFPTIEEISIDQFPETIVAGAIERLLRLAEKFTEELQSHETQKSSRSNYQRQPNALGTKKPCTHPGCPQLVPSRESKCAEHSKLSRKERRRRYEKQSSPFYRSAAWTRLRMVILRREPLCRQCARSSPKRITAAQMVDHIVPINQGGAPLDERNLQPLCNDCHQRKRGQEAHD